MKKYNFDRIINRRGTDSLKWGIYKSGNITPHWVADMDFQSPPAIIDALHQRVEHGIFGYAHPPAELKEVTAKHNEFLKQNKDTVALVEERDGLLAENNDLKATIDFLKEKLENLQSENEGLVRDEILKWFLAGGGVFFLGLIIGKVSRRRKRF